MRFRGLKSEFYDNLPQKQKFRLEFILALTIALLVLLTDGILRLMF